MELAAANHRPAPWRLTGEGYILVYRLSRSFVEQEGHLPEALRPRFAGGLASVMLVDYADSDVGPYRELLFIPGRVSDDGRKYHSISRIYVSSVDSMVNGRRNWGIPKECADISFEKGQGRSERIAVNTKGELVADFTMISKGISFPITTRLLPFRTRLLQEDDGKVFCTGFSASGRARIAGVESVKINRNLFPDVSHHKPLFAINVSPFTMTFSVPRIEQC